MMAATGNYFGDGLPITIFNDLHYHKSNKSWQRQVMVGACTYELELPVQIKTALKTGFGITGVPKSFYGHY